MWVVALYSCVSAVFGCLFWCCLLEWFYLVFDCYFDLVLSYVLCFGFGFWNAWVVVLFANCFAVALAFCY